METMNWSEQSERKQYPVHEAGTYLMTLDGWKKGESRSSKSPQLEVDFTLEDGSPLGGVTFKDYLPLSSAALWRTAMLVKGCGVDMSTLPEMVVGQEEFNRVLDMLKGRKVYVVLEKEPYIKQGETETKYRNKVKDYLVCEDQSPAPAWGSDSSAVPDFIKNKVNKAGLA